MKKLNASVSGRGIILQILLLVSIRNEVEGLPLSLHIDRGNSAIRPQAPHSASSSIDGYESFENTNNKKKRKIPGPGTAGGHSSNLSTDLANMGIAGGIEPDGTGGSADQYYGTGSSAVPVAGSGTGISGAGRGRYGRSGKGVNQLRPLGASTTGLNAFANKAANRGKSDMSTTEGTSEQAA